MKDKINSDFSCISVFFIGPIAPVNDVPKGGYEAANRRTIANFKKHKSLQILEFPYPNTRNNKILKILDYGTGFIKIIYNLIKSLVNFKSSIKPVCHITGLYKQFIYVEIVFIAICKLFNLKVIYEVRAGSMFYHYYNRSNIYRVVFKLVLKLSDYIGIEGYEYYDFVKNHSKKNPIYMPNYVDKIVPLESVKKRNHSLSYNINLIYFGRLSSAKGIEILINCFLELYETKKQSTLEIIGVPVSQAYFLKLKLLIKNNSSIKIIQGMPQKKLFSKLKEKHFFVFPTRHYGEGHSNALTEAMANGCVPICSDAGFNKSVVGQCGAVLPINSKSAQYKDAILNIINQKNWRKLSTCCIKRIQNNYHRSVIINNYYKLYQTCSKESDGQI